MNYKKIMMTLATLVLGLGTVFTASAAHAAKPIKKYVNLRLDEPTVIAGVTLQPGDYSVKIVQSPDGSTKPTLEFSHYLDTSYADQGLSLYDEEIVLKIEASAQDLSVPARKTELVRSSTYGNTVSGLDVRGKRTQYVFGTAANLEADGQ